jgi:hypothetical protein
MGPKVGRYLNMREKRRGNHNTGAYRDHADRVPLFPHYAPLWNRAQQDGTGPQKGDVVHVFSAVALYLGRFGGLLPRKMAG